MKINSVIIVNTRTKTRFFFFGTVSNNFFGMIEVAMKKKKIVFYSSGYPG